MKKVTVPFFISHQGCAHSCVFCDQRTITGFSGDLPSQEEIVTKVQTWKGTAGERPLEVAFFGGSFTAMPHQVQEHLLGTLQPMLDDGTVQSVRISTRPDYITDENVRWLKEKRVLTIELGVQSMDDQVLRESVRGHRAEESESAIRCIKSGGLEVGAQLMPGLPGDTPYKSYEALKRVIAAGADFVRIYPVVVLKGTALAERYQAGKYTPLTVDQGVQLCKILLHESLRSSVPVIRIGLQADEGLNSTTVVGGCWHPSFGRLVRSELYFDLLRSMIAGSDGTESCTIRCHPARVSEVSGQGRANLKRLGARFESTRVVAEERLKNEELVLECLNKSFTGNCLTDLSYTIDKESLYA